jgi:putative transposase
LLTKDIRHDLHLHIIHNCRQKNIFLQSVNGYDEHIHCLISLGRDQTPAKIAQLIKGESSFWINKNHLTCEPFSWQDDYFAVSVSESKVKLVENYIRNQENHHAKKTFAEEANEFMTRYGWSNVK